MTEQSYIVIASKGSRRRPIYAWTKGVPIEDGAREQLLRVASLPFVHEHIAVMPDVHFGIGATVGSVIPTRGAIVPAAVGVDVGCGMCAVPTNLRREDLPEDLGALRRAIEHAVPHGRTDNGGRNDRGAWGSIPGHIQAAWDEQLGEGFERLLANHPRARRANSLRHLGTLGTGNHFIEVELDTTGQVWLMVHSGSRGIGGALANDFIKAAKKLMRDFHIVLPDPNLAYLPESHGLFHDYVQAVTWAQRFARVNRQLMLAATVEAVSSVSTGKACQPTDEPIDCHHNYVAEETHGGQTIWVTRKGAVRAGEGDRGIIPGSMGARSYIVRGKGEPRSFMSCSHGAGRAMSRGEAKRRFTEADHRAATAGVECRKDATVIDETPAAYKDIDAVMAAQADLVAIEQTVKQIVCVKG